MRRVFAILGVVTVVGLSAGLLNADDGYVSPQPVVTADGGCPECAAAPRCPHCGHLKAYKASFGCFNCYCRGGYKYPVLPQYTYFWPGLYSQQAMTAYASPYRYPPLNLPPDMVTPPPAPVPPVAPQPKVSRAHQASHLTTAPVPFDNR